MSIDEDRALVLAHYGQPVLPWRVRRAVGRLARHGRRDPQELLLAARTLAHTANSMKAYAYYRRAAKLAPEDLQIAEETGLLGSRIGATVSRSWPMYLLAARADPSRRPRVDPVLLKQARRLPAELSLWASVLSIFAVMIGAFTVRKGYPLQRTIPPDFDPFPPIIGPLAGLAFLLVFGGLIWLAFVPVRRFGRDILRRSLRRPRIIHVLAMVAAVTCVLGSLAVAWFGALPQFETYAVWLLPAWGAGIVLSLAGLPFNEVLGAVVQAAGNVAGDALKK